MAFESQVLTKGIQMTNCIRTQEQIDLMTAAGGKFLPASTLGIPELQASMFGSVRIGFHECDE